jgi:hypothetical protein
MLYTSYDCNVGIENIKKDCIVWSWYLIWYKKLLGFNISIIYIFLTIFITDFDNDNHIGKEDLMMMIDRLTQKQLHYQDKQKIIEGVSMKCFCVFSYRRVDGLLYICQCWIHWVRWSHYEGSLNALLLSWTQSHNRPKPHDDLGLLVCYND